MDVQVDNLVAAIEMQSVEESKRENGETIDEGSQRQNLTSLLVASNVSRSPLK